MAAFAVLMPPMDDSQAKRNGEELAIVESSPRMGYAFKNFSSALK